MKNIRLGSESNREGGETDQLSTTEGGTRESIVPPLRPRHHQQHKTFASHSSHSHFLLFFSRCWDLAQSRCSAIYRCNTYAPLHVHGRPAQFRVQLAAAAAAHACRQLVMSA